MGQVLVPKIEAASDQLDWAIKLFLDHGAYVSAITLAGAAEEIVGSALGQQSIFAQLKKTFAERFSVPEKEISQRGLNRAKNWLKHWSDLREHDVIELDLKNEAIHYIVRAIANFAAFDDSATSESPRFIEWLSANWDAERGA